ncbi:AraC family transcriptional regulator [Allokutzneria sp. A3M-2-11 16]|uniref:AraC family transcriptional regulator n=1 Tax=Allokutzneria sp. A3M-2-11 16 TaxID=2962043 RepID=UPI0020B6AB6D|nr:AraC family transcriptional regulator [Allokutzneria sp. A3M-2-11 16]MCP3804477.1 AraC family transcriptional regulator [Allokutzneria sp. A3M-2-11 16]
MDAFGDLLRGVRANGALFGRTVLTSPWALRFVDGATLTLCTMINGEGWVVSDDGRRTHIPHRGTVIVRGPAPFVVVDDPSREVHEALDIRCATTCPSTLDSDAAAMVVGIYTLESGVGRRLLAALPPVLVAPEECGGEDDAVLRFIAEEAAAERPGQQVVLDRLLDWLLVCTLRAWFDRSAPAWYQAQSDPVVGQALRALHSDPARSWTVASLASSVGVSRAALAKRFTALVGEPPLTYLTGWRMDLAADLLAEPESTVASVARRVGYADGFAFSAAFKRVRGVAPSALRLAKTS